MLDVIFENVEKMGLDESKAPIEIMRQVKLYNYLDKSMEKEITQEILSEYKKYLEAIEK